MSETQAVGSDDASAQFPGLTLAELSYSVRYTRTHIAIPGRQRHRPGALTPQLSCTRHGHSTTPLQIKSTDMMPRLSNAAISIAQEVMQQTTNPSAVAAALKQGFDSQFGLAWHCAVGKNFGSQVVHEARSFIFFTMGGFSVLLFRSGTE
jgi:dynein light chain LC8-type